MDLLESFQNSLIFLPDRNNYGSPESEGFDFEEVYVKTPDGETLHGYFFPCRGDHVHSDKVLIYLHGNAQNVSAWYLAVTEIIKNIPVNILIVDYRGYGKSTGKPSLKGVIVDAISMYDYVIERGFKEENISLLGRSLGGGIALELATRKKIKSINLISAFTSLADMCREHYPAIPLNIVKNELLNSKELIQKVSSFVFIVHGDKDTIVNVSHAYNLFENANEPKKLLILKGAGHNEINPYLTNDYFKILGEML